jgi:hypothetical protein
LRGLGEIDAVLQRIVVIVVRFCAFLAQKIYLSPYFFIEMLRKFGAVVIVNIPESGDNGARTGIDE